MSDKSSAVFVMMAMLITPFAIASLVLVATGKVHPDAAEFMHSVLFGVMAILSWWLVYGSLKEGDEDAKKAM